MQEHVPLRKQPRARLWAAASAMVCAGLGARAALGVPGPLPSLSPSLAARPAALSLGPGPLSLGPRPLPRGLELQDPLLAAFGFDRFSTPSLERPSIGGSFRDGRYGLPSWSIVPRLSLSGGGPAGAPSPPPTAPLPPLQAGPDGLRLSLASVPLPAPSAAPACLKRAISFVRYGAEQDTFSLLRCDGSIAPEALDRLSVLARPPNAERPSLPLPEDPEPSAVPAGEWVENVRLLNPRLVWLVQKLVEAFPRRPIYLMSGYRPGSHAGLHGQGRALDLFVMNVPNERVYKFCRTLPDVGCGYYPNNKFVHLDVRPQGTGKAYWVDTSAPGEPSRYVDSWPGVEKGGAASWRGGE